MKRKPASISKCTFVLQNLNNQFLFFVLSLIFSASVTSAQSVGAKSDIDLLLLKEEYQKASALLETAVKQDTSNYELFFKLGLSYKKQFIYEKAINAFNKCLSLNNNIVQASFLLADSYSELGDAQKAIALYQQILSADSTNTAAAINLAAILQNNDNYLEAIDLYENIFKTDTLNSYVFHQLGYCYSKIDSLTKTIYYSSRALSINSNDIAAFKLLANSYIKSSLFDEADSLTRDRFEKDPENPVYNKLRGEVFFAKKNYDNAIFHYRKAIRAGDSSAYCYSKIGVANYLFAAERDTSKIYFNENYYRSAKFWLEKSLSKENSPVNCYFLAMVYLKLKNHDKSIIYFDKALKLILPNILHEIYVHKSECHTALKQFPEVVEALKCALFYKKENKNILLNIAEVYEKELHDNKSALLYYNQYLDISDEGDENIVRIKQHIKSLKQAK